MVIPLPPKSPHLYILKKTGERRPHSDFSETDAVFVVTAGPCHSLGAVGSYFLMEALELLAYQTCVEGIVNVSGSLSTGFWQIVRTWQWGQCLPQLQTHEMEY